VVKTVSFEFIPVAINGGGERSSEGMSRLFLGSQSRPIESIGPLVRELPVPVH
jgi:hypothetical protein